ncbi:MAG: hypothetical protein ACPGVO_10135 [Spirulinaceae cyanobacterium]
MGRFWGWLIVGWILGGLAIAPVVAAPTPPATPQPIAQVRQHLPDEPVTVQGIVTVPSGAFASGTGDRGFAIQDATAGIYISTAADWQLALNQAVQVTGSVQDDGHGLLVLAPQAPIQRRSLDADASLLPRSVSTGVVGEATEGELVQIQGKITEPPRRDPPYGTGILLDDGSGPVQVFINASTGIVVPDWQPGQWLRVQGFSGQYEQYIEVSPRVEADLVVVD